MDRSPIVKKWTDLTVLSFKVSQANTDKTSFYILCILHNNSLKLLLIE